MKVCPICGKLFACQPEFWPYRRGDNFLCRENCMIVFDTREFREKSGWCEDYYRRKKQMKKVTLEQKKKAVEIAIGGGNPLPFLRKCGSDSPEKLWYVIKQNLKKVDPDTFAKIPARLNPFAKKEAPEKKPEDGMDCVITIDRKCLEDILPEYPVATCCAPSTREGVEVPDELPEEEPENLIGKSAEIIEKREDDMKDERKPVNYDGYEVSAIRSEVLGEFYFDRKFNSLDWRTAEGEEIGMSPAGWQMLMNELPKIMGILGI